jgi:SMODS and SLOG-associating 2TM effector domain family 5
MNSSDISAYSEMLDNRLWKTKGSRFNAVRRLNNKNQLSIMSISILSVYGIAIPVGQSVLGNRCPDVNNTYTAISTVLSVFTLALSLLEGSKNYQLRAERLYSNAIKISNLSRELEYLRKCEPTAPDLPERLFKISSRYEALIEDCPENHSSEDYQLFEIQNRRHFKISWLSVIYIRIKLILIDYWLYGFVLGIPPLLFFLYSSC